MLLTVVCSKEIELKCDKSVQTFLNEGYQKYCQQNATRCVFNRIESDRQDTFKHPAEAARMECVIFVHPDMRKLPSDFLSNYKVVKFVDLSYSKLMGIENFAVNGKTLLEVNLRGNRITSLEGMIFNGAHSLRSIDLSHNVIKSIDEFTFSNLKSLEELNLSNNQIEELDGLYKSNTLKSLDLSFNKLTFLFVPYDAFSDMLKLERINLRNNSVGIDYGIFASNLNLKMIDLSYTGLTYFDLNILLSSKSIEELHLSGNGIEYYSQFNVEFSSSFPNLKKIGLGDNRFACESLSQLVRKLDKSKIAIHVEEGKFIKHTRNIRGIYCV